MDKEKLCSPLPEGAEASLPEEQGEVSQKGRWALLRDGTLRLFGGDILLGCACSKNKIRRIVVEDFWSIGPHAFEGLPACTELVFHRPYVQVHPAAFAHCPRLEKVVFAGDAQLFYESFLDTPFEAREEGSSFSYEYLPNQALARGQWGKKLLRSLREEIAGMDRPKSAGDTGFLPSLAGGVPAFPRCFDMILQGAMAGEPELMFLLAELLRHDPADERAILSRLDQLAGKPLDRSPEDWYILAARVGSERARLWCAFCMDTGTMGFPADPDGAAELLRGVDCPPRTLAPYELSFLAEAAATLHEKAISTELEELLIAEEHDFTAGIERFLPDPDTDTLRRRGDALSALMALLGLPYVLIASPQVPDPRIALAIERIRSEKEAWLAWCREKGFEIFLLSA